jgi:hypothetical protein
MAQLLAAPVLEPEEPLGVEALLAAGVAGLASVLLVVELEAAAEGSAFFAPPPLLL